MRGKGSKLGKPCPKVRLSQDRLPIEPLPFSGLLRIFGNITFGIITQFRDYYVRDFYVRDCFVREKFVAPLNLLLLDMVSLCSVISLSVAAPSEQPIKAWPCPHSQGLPRRM